MKTSISGREAILSLFSQLPMKEQDVVLRIINEESKTPVCVREGHTFKACGAVPRLFLPAKVKVFCVKCGETRIV